jgi:hypothetical protein
MHTATKTTLRCCGVLGGWLRQQTHHLHVLRGRTCCFVTISCCWSFGFLVFLLAAVAISSALCTAKQKQQQQ